MDYKVFSSFSCAIHVLSLQSYRLRSAPQNEWLPPKSPDIPVTSYLWFLTLWHHHKIHLHYALQNGEFGTSEMINEQQNYMDIAFIFVSWRFYRNDLQMLGTILPKDTLTCEPGKSGIKPATFRLKDNQGVSSLPLLGLLLFCITQQICLSIVEFWLGGS